jgi:hypothetical protein
MIGLFKELDPFNPFSPLSSRIMYEIGDANTRYLIDEIIKQGPIVVYFLVKELFKNGGT